MNAVGSIVLVSLAIALAGCVTPRSDAEVFLSSMVPAPANDEVVLIVFRQITPPTIGKLTVQANNSSTAELPNNSYTVLKVKSGPAVVTVTYPFYAAIKTTKVETSFEGGSTHYLEIVGGLGSISMPGPYVQIWAGLVERERDDAERLLTNCCRRVWASTD